MKASILNQKQKLLWLFITIIVFSTVSFFSVKNDYIYNAYLSNDCISLNLSNNYTNDLKNNGEYWYFKGLCELQSKNYSEAKISFFRANKSEYNYKAYVYFGISVSEFELKNNDQGYKFLKKALNNGLQYMFLEHWLLDEVKNDELFKDFKIKNKPSFDFWTSVLIFLSIQGLLFGVYLIFKKSRRKEENVYLAIILIGFCLLITSYSLNISNLDYYFNGLQNCHHYFLYILGPIFYLYAKKILMGLTFSRLDIKHFIPLPIIILSILLFNDNIIPYYIYNVLLSPWLKTFHLIFYVVITYKIFLIRRAKFGSEVHNWFLLMFYSFCFFLAANIYASTIMLSHSHSIVSDVIIIISMCLFVLLFMSIGYVKPEVFDGLSMRKVLKFKKYRKTGMSKELSIDFKNKLLDLMQKEKLYMNGDLTLDELALKMSISRHQVSQVINENFNMSFFDFVNKFRVEEVKNLFLLYPELNILESAYRSGFNNKSSFNKAFKKIVRITPSEYKSRLLIKK